MPVRIKGLGVKVSVRYSVVRKTRCEIVGLGLSPEGGPFSVC